MYVRHYFLKSLFTPTQYILYVTVCVFLEFFFFGNKKGEVESDTNVSFNRRTQGTGN